MGYNVYFAEHDTPIKMGIYQTSDTLPDGGRIGMKLRIDDGRVFKLAKAGVVALAAGKAVQGVVPVVAHLNCAVAEAAADEAVKVKVTLGATAAAANLYAEGTLHVNAAAGAGYCHKIRGHAAIAASGSDYFTLYDPLAKALTTASKVTLTKNLWDSVVIAPAGGLTAAIAGVPVVDVPANNYFWCQTAGQAPVLTQGTVVIGQNVGLGGTADGACGPVALDTTVIWGYVMRVNASTEYSLIFLQIAP
jgi:hypothetical protein